MYIRLCASHIQIRRRGRAVLRRFWAEIRVLAKVKSKSRQQHGARYTVPQQWRQVDDGADERHLGQLSSTVLFECGAIPDGLFNGRKVFAMGCLKATHMRKALWLLVLEYKKGEEE
ncbi:integrase-type DNA-binding superfamily protein [Striga asiatica]|uniref:Integrase-type DNA-binding superfamily protein n=1 Tax=Striga asiatica TaxID=4170 RepID=A0A5A7QXS9_STRAF|nr:integrase-type DNA-binding superfamily protein [Striga asiatica]